MTSQITLPNIDESAFFDLHLKVLTRLLNGINMEKIEHEFQTEFESLDYLSLAKRGLLAFNKEKKLIGAYPISPVKSNYKVTVEGIGSGYSMCAIDALGVAYTFETKTTIETTDFSTGDPIKIVIDPSLEKQEFQDLVIAHKKTSEVPKGTAPAVSLCPSINFYSDKSNVDTKHNDIMDFDEALVSARSQFTQSAFQSCINTAIAKDQGIELTGGQNACCSNENESATSLNTEQNECSCC
ncbi:MAG: hypothetical protein GPJ54_18500 [Candidatus Heimdallarchaeota archaeon]|nr:hypothetical protein [Candidatus Heimdallarchaeota archaeon]